MYGSTIASDLVCLAGLVSELNAVPGLLDDLPSGRPGTAPEMGGESGNFSVQHEAWKDMCEEKRIQLIEKMLTDNKFI